jgi:hypothetical protein
VIRQSVVREKIMTTIDQTPPFLLARATVLLLSGRIYFPKNPLGEIILGDEDFRIFRQMILTPSGAQPEHPRAIFKVCFHFASFSINTNRILSLIPIPFIVAEPGFRSKTWLIGQKTGIFQGLYEWDTVEDAENYWDSFPMKLMKKRALPGSLTRSISKIPNMEYIVPSQCT